MGKWKSPNLSETQGFQCPGHSNWTICSLLNQLYSENFPNFDFYSGEGQFLITYPSSVSSSVVSTITSFISIGFRLSETFRPTKSTKSTTEFTLNIKSKSATYEGQKWLGYSGIWVQTTKPTLLSWNGISFSLLAYATAWQRLPRMLKPGKYILQRVIYLPDSVTDWGV